MKKNIVRIEDITSIIGMQNYIECLSLDEKKLIYLGYDINDNLSILRFTYENHEIRITINKEHSIKNLECDCKEYGNNYCKHTGIAVIYIMQHEDLLEDIISKINNSYDEVFNSKLFSLFNDYNRNKIKLKLEVVIKKLYNDNFELQIKIGENKTYVLKKHMDNFLNAYNGGSGEVMFGTNFTYNPKVHYFDNIDDKIIKFVNIYVSSQINKNYYSYYTNNDIILSKYSLKEFMKLLDNRAFSIEEGYEIYNFNGINRNYDLDIGIINNNDSISLSINDKNIYPIIEDYSYVIKNNELIYFKSEVRKLVSTLLQSNKNNIIFKEKDYSNLANIILPKLKLLNKNLDFEEISDKIKFDNLSVRYYFEKNKDKIIANIKLFFNNEELNILDDNCKIDNRYIVRDKNKEFEYIKELLNLGFKFDQKSFLMENEDDIINFIDGGLKDINSKYEVYISKNLKDISVIKKVNIKNTFSIGSDNILNYNFDVDFDKSEISKILDAVVEKKKFYRLKNGNYIKLEDSEELNELISLVDNLDIDFKELEKDCINLPKYKSMQLNDNKFIKLDGTVKQLLEEFNKYKDINVRFDKTSSQTLRDYQKLGVKWMLTISKCGFGGILADEMGLGKSLQTITYIKKKLSKNSKFLIIVPTSLIYNWENEFNKFAPDIKYLIVNDIRNKRMEQLNNINDYNVIITTYGLIRQDIQFYENYQFDTCIIDEAQNIKNIAAETTQCVKMIKATTKFALTGTPIENSVLELWSIFDYIMPGFLPHLSKFKKIYNIKNIEDDNELLHNLNKMISPFIMRRKKKDVLKDLPDKIENNVIIELSDKQKKIYLEELDKTKKEIDETIAKEVFLKSQILILSLLTKLRQICIDPRLIFDNYNEMGSKFVNLIDILKQIIDNGHKILLFSQYPSALRLLMPDLNSNNIKYYYLDGSTKAKERINLVDKFNSDDTNVFLISLKAGGTGLNLVSADVVIHLDPWWNPQVENQATDRAHRIGQKNVVEVVKLITKGTIEEKIVELQKKKKDLSDKIIEGENRDKIVLSKLTEDDIRNLFI